MSHRVLALSTDQEALRRWIAAALDQYADEDFPSDMPNHIKQGIHAQLTFSFYTPPCFVVTRWGPQFSWLFEEITRILWTKPFYTFETKVEIFAGLAGAADRAGLSVAPLTDVLGAVVEEAIVACADLKGLARDRSIETRTLSPRRA